jgi:hypothetical protein
MRYENNSMCSFERKVLGAVILSAFMALPASTSATRPDVPPGKASSTPTYDYRDYTAPAVLQKVYEATPLGGPSYTITESMTHMPESGELLIDQKRSAEGVTVSHYVYHYRLTDTDYLWDWQERRDPESGALVFSDSYDPPLSIRQSAMPEGVNRGGAAVVSRSPDNLKFGITRVNSALGLDDVEVPYGAFSDCLRMFEESNGIHRVSWYCPEVGLTKRVFGDSANQEVWELTGCDGCPTQ